MNTLQEAVLLAHYRGSPSTPGACRSPGAAQRRAGDQRWPAQLARDLQQAGCPVVHFQWAPIAGGNPHLAALLKQLNF
jgi:FdrA protein